MSDLAIALSAFAPMFHRDVDEVRAIADEAIEAGRRVGKVVGDAVDVLTDPKSKGTAAEWMEIGGELAQVLPPALMAVEALARAFGLDEALADWRARAPERRAARRARRAERRRDTDGDGVPDRRDRDDDNDGVPDKRDVAPQNPAVALHEDLRAAARREPDGVR